METLNELINRQVNRWTVERRAMESGSKETDWPESALRVSSKAVVTISRQHGCRGQEFCKLIAHHLDYGVFDRNIIDFIARDQGVRREVIESLDQHSRSHLELWVQNLLRQRTFDYDDYFRALSKVIKATCLHGGVVILGRGANYLLADSFGYRIRVIAPEEQRIQNLISSRGMKENQAQQEIKRIDTERAQFVKNYFHKDINNPCEYDLIINLGTHTLDAGAKIALSALRARGWPMETTGGDKRRRVDEKTREALKPVGA